MADGVDGFVGRLDIVDRRGVHRHWSADMKARIIAESLQPGNQVAEVAQRYDLNASQLSHWRKQAREGRIILPAELMPAVPPLADTEPSEPAFVPLSIAGEPTMPAVAPRAPETVKALTGIVSIEIGADLVVKVPDDVAVSRVAALVRAMRGMA